MENNHISYFTLSIHPSTINVYYQSTAARRYKLPVKSSYEDSLEETTKQPIQFRDNFHNGMISSIAKRKISRSVDYLIHLAKPKLMPNPYHGKHFTFKVNFVTLSLSSEQVHTDQVIKSELLNQFLIEMTRRWKVQMYIWRAEKQVNGRIHFHILTDAFIPWNELRNVWNRIQQKLGYVTRYRTNRLLWHDKGFHYDPRHKERWPYARQLKAYKDGIRTDWENPNSVDVHSLRYIRNVKAYIVKYVSKNREMTEEQKRMYNELSEIEKDKIRDSEHVSGKLWSCSTNLTDLSGGNVDVCSDIEEELTRVFDDNKNSRYDSDYFHVYNVNNDTLRRLKCFNLIECFEEYIRKKFPDLYLAVSI